MLEILQIVGDVIYILVLTLGVVASFLQLPGSVVMLLAGFVYSAVHGWAEPPWWLIVVLIPVAVLVELSDNVLSAAGVKRLGGSNATMFWAVAGGLVGALVFSLLIPVPVVSALAGALVGGFLGGFVYEIRRGTPRAEASRAGWGAIGGRLLGGLVKGVLMTVLTVVLVWFSF